MHIVIWISGKATGLAERVGFDIGTEASSKQQLRSSMALGLWHIVWHKRRHTFAAARDEQPRCSPSIGSSSKPLRRTHVQPCNTLTGF